MITNFAELLKEFARKEVEILDRQNISHPPTIGEMYEGLTKDLLTKSIPAKLGLQIVEGFITNDKGVLSNQIDCMLVSGKGEKIPYTNSYKHNIANVIAVIEVKKALYTDDLVDAYNNLRKVYDIFQPKAINYDLFRDSYVSIMGEVPPLRDKVNSLPFWKQQIYRSLILEELLPIRIGIGYHGFSREENFRESFINYLNSNIGKPRYGPVSLPNLLISKNYSIVKLNGMPYSVPIAQRKDGFWHILASYSGNPLILLLELIWTKITYHFELYIHGYNDDLQVERLKPLLVGKATNATNKVGWEYEFMSFSEKELATIPLYDTWQPTILTAEQAAVITELMEFDEIDTTDPEFVNFINQHDDVDNFISTLVATGIVAHQENKLTFLTQECGLIAMPDGTFVAGENNSGRLSNWLEKQIKITNKAQNA